MPDTEAQWLKQAQQGNQEAFSRLVELYQVSVYNLCYRMLGNPNDAEDAAQETFIRAFKAIMRYDPNRKFSTWLFAIASNYCIDQHRRRRLPTVEIENLPYQNLPDSGSTPEALLISDEDQEQVQGLLEVLSPQDRAAIVMRYWYDFSYQDISAALSLSVSAVKSRLHRARRDLASEWLKLGTQTTLAERMQHETPTF